MNSKSGLYVTSIGSFGEAPSTSKLEYVKEALGRLQCPENRALAQDNLELFADLVQAGRPQYREIFQEMAKKYQRGSTVVVIACGPQEMTTAAYAAADECFANQNVVRLMEVFDY